MPAKRILSAALALLLVAAIPARAASVPTITVVDSINPGSGSSSAMDSSDSVALGDYLYFLANDGTNGNLWRVSAAGTIESASPAGTNVFFGCMCERPILTLNGRLFAPVTTDETGFEFAYLDERTFGLPGTNRDGSVWSMALVLLALVPWVRHLMGKDHH